MRFQWPGVILFLVVAFTLLDVEFSRQQGRLLWVSDWDDVGYLLQGTRMLESYRESGWGAFWQTWTGYGFHAPLETLLAASSFSIAGYRHDAPYYANGLFLGVYLSGLAYFLRRLRVQLGAMILLAFATLPFATMIVVEYRPDPIWSVVMGWGAMFALAEPDFCVCWRKRWLHCLCFALAMWLKPAAFIVTLTLFASSLVAPWLISGLPRSGWWGMLLSWLKQLGLFAILIAPLLWLNGSHMLSYFLDHWYGPGKAVWHQIHAPRDPFSYYLIGKGAACNLGFAGVPLAIFLSLALCLRKERRRALGVAAFLALCYLIPTVSTIKTPFLGGPLYATFLFACAESLGRIHFHSPRRVMALVMVALMCSTLWRFPPSSRRDDPSCPGKYRLQTDALELMEKAGLPNSPRILFAQGGPVLPYSVCLLLLWRGVRVNMYEASWEREPTGFRSRLEDADLIVVQPPGHKVAGFDYSWMPSDRFLEGHLELIEAAPEFERYATLHNSLDGKPIYLYRRKAVAGRQDTSPLW